MKKYFHFSGEKSSSRNQQSYEEIKKQSAERLKNLRAEKNAQIDEVLLFTDGMKSTHPLCAADFIYAEDFIGEADFAHPTGWISLKRNTFCLVDKRCSFSGDPYGTRTHVTAVKGRCLNHLTNGPGSGNLTRTDDTPGMNRMLYQLSYAAISCRGNSKMNYIR